MKHSSFHDFLTRERIACGTYLPETDSLLFSDSVWDEKQKTATVAPCEEWPSLVIE